MKGIPMKRSSVKVAGLIPAVIAVALLTGAASCDKANEPFKDAPRSGTVNNDPADIIEMPDGFSNLATKCDHGNRIYTGFHGDSKYGIGFAVPHDPTCPQTQQ
jgi:hypothetical protein